MKWLSKELQAPLFNNPQIQAAYQAEDCQIRLLHAKVGCILALILMPAGSSLDYFVYPEFLKKFFIARMVSDVFLALFLALFYFPFGKRYINLFSTAWAMVPTWAICWMIYISEGPTSPYYAGLNLMIIVICFLLPYTLKEAIAFCSVILISYLVTCLLHFHAFDYRNISTSILYNNIYFLALTSIISVTACWYRYRSRVQEFLLRHELNEKNQTLAENYRALSTLERMKSQFFANISHELRTPLTLIFSPVEKLLQEAHTLPPKVYKAAELIMHNALRLLKLVNDILDLIRMEEGGGESFQFKPVRLNTFLAGVVNSIQHLAIAKGLSLKAFGETEPIYIYADPNKLEKVFLNLLMNAIKFTEKGGRITARWKIEKNKAVVELEDTGIGIAEDQQKHIFERFHQVDASATRKFQGLGIGLSLVRDIIVKHDGILTVQSKLGVGSTFKIELPLYEKEVKEAVLKPEESEDPIVSAFRSADRFAVSANTKTEETSESFGSGKHAILVVDDEIDMRRFLTEALSEKHRVFQAEDGETGFRIALAKKPDLIVLDWMLPGISGLEVCENLRKQPDLSNLKILMLTARIDDQSKLSALQKGADDFLLKPFTTLELETRIANLLKTADLQSEMVQKNTDLEESFERLKAAEATLVQSEKMSAIGTLSAGLLHEINNPLNYAIMALRSANKRVHEEEASRCVKDALEGVERIADIITDLKGFAHPGENGNWCYFDFHECLDSALRLMHHEIRNYEIIQDIQSTERVYGSKNEIMHVLMNLIGNSAKALADIKTQPAQIKISVKSINDFLEISVQDNGCGISQKNLSRIFDPFFTTRKLGEGMGMGLSLCQTIIKNHGGTIKADSQENKWTIITFTLPTKSEATKKDN